LESIKNNKDADYKETVTDKDVKETKPHSKVIPKINTKIKVSKNKDKIYSVMSDRSGNIDFEKKDKKKDKKKNVKANRNNMPNISNGFDGIRNKNLQIPEVKKRMHSSDFHYDSNKVKKQNLEKFEFD